MKKIGLLTIALGLMSAVCVFVSFYNTTACVPAIIFGLGSYAWYKNRM